MKGILIVNAFLTGNRFNVLYEMLKKSFAEKNIELDVVTNKDVLIKINNFSLECDFIIYWDKDILLSRYPKHFLFHYLQKVWKLFAIYYFPSGIIPL